MRIAILTISLLAAGLVQAQQKTEVPEVYAIAGTFDRVIVLRFKFDTDLLTGIEAMVKKEKIKNAVFLSGAGSVRNYHVHTVGTRDLPPKNIFLKNPKKPADIISVNGYVIDGRVHAHITLMDDKTAFGGHLEPGNNVLTYAAITLGVLSEGTDLSHLDDMDHR